MTVSPLGHEAENGRRQNGRQGKLDAVIEGTLCSLSRWGSSTLAREQILQLDIGTLHRTAPSKIDTRSLSIDLQGQYHYPFQPHGMRLMSNQELFILPIYLECTAG